MSLSTHVLDTAHGRPAAGMALALYGADGLIGKAVTNEDGRLDTPILPDGVSAVGEFRLVFRVAAYFRALGVTLADPPFLDEVTIAFGMSAGGGHYHVPLLVSPYGYTTYRGS